MFSKPHGQRQVRGAGSADIDGGVAAAWVATAAAAAAAADTGLAAARGRDLAWTA